MKLYKMTIDHFKGLEKLELSPHGSNITIRGKNGTYKSTVADAYAWCLTGKGFDGKTIDTQIKLRGEDGSTPNDGGVEHSVELVFKDDGGRQISFRRMFKEKWEKQRGTASRSFKGHTTDYSIDDVPMAKKEFERKVEEIFKGETFQLLSMPLHFMTNVKWQDRRKVLMTMCGDTPNEKIIDDNKSLEPLREELKTKDIADLRKIIQSKMKKNNEEVKSIPARIDELVGMKDGAADGDKKQLETDIKVLEKTLDERQAGLAAIKNGGRNAAIQQMNAEIEAKMTKFKAEMEADYNRKASEAERTINGCRSEIERLGYDIEHNQKDIERLETTAETADKLAAKLRKEWNEVHAEPFPDNVSDICPCCGQKLPAEKVESIRAAELQKFNLNKAERLKAIQEKGKNIMAGKNSDLSAVATLKTANEEKQARIDELSKSLAEAQKMLDGVSKPEPEKHPEYITLKEQLDFNIHSMENDNEADKELKELEEQITTIRNEISDRQKKLAAIEQNEGIDARVDELKDREKTLGKMYSNLEAQLFLTEEFLRAKVRATEDNINSHFKYVRWKMFDQRINGALEECCEPLIDGVPFSDGLNKGSRMKAALDINNALSDYFGIVLPVIIDDCESYTSLPETKAQLIKLIADGNHDSLSVEID